MLLSLRINIIFLVDGKINTEESNISGKEIAMGENKSTKEKIQCLEGSYKPTNYITLGNDVSACE